MEFLMMVESVDTAAGVPTGGSTATIHKIQSIHSICQTNKTSPKHSHVHVIIVCILNHTRKVRERIGIWYLS